MKKLIVHSIIFVVSTLNVNVGQTINGIYGIYRINTQISLAKADLFTGNFGLAEQSTFTDSITKRFFFSNGARLAIFDLISLTLVEDTALPVLPGQLFKYITFNPCDSSLYGILNNPPQSQFAKFSLTNFQFTNLANNVYGPGLGAGYFLDYINNMYIFMYGITHIHGYSLNTGQQVLNLPIQNLQGESLRHIALNCSDNTVYGTSVNSDKFTKYFSKIDLQTGIVQHVSSNNLNSYYWKNTVSMYTLAPFIDEYYYVSPPSNLVPVNIGTGAAQNVLNLNLNSNENFEYITYYPQCSCLNLISNLNYNDITDTLIIKPNPATNVIKINLAANKSSEAKIYDVVGKLIKQETINDKNEINVSELNPGIYFLKVITDEKEIVSKFIKQ